MNSTEAAASPAVGGRQVGQVVAGRYRLAVSKGGDEVADVWHALDESTQTVVTLEILRDRGNDATRQRFLAEARRMAAIERPSVMRVASILDEGAETFIVFEHLIPLPVVLTGLTAVARDARPVASVAPSTLGAVAGPTRSAAPEDPAGDKTEAVIVELAGAREPSVPDPVVATSPGENMPDAVRSLLSAKTDVTRVVPVLTRLLADARGFIRDVLKDVQMDTIIDDARAFIADARGRMSRRFDTTALRSLAARSAARAKPTIEVAASADSAAARTGPAVPALPNLAASMAGLASAATSLAARARGNRLVLAGAAGILVVIVLIVSPLDDTVASALRSAPAPTATVAPRAALVPAAFVVPPLSAYGATFESQGPYPTTTPNGTVEWVVALRNTGSAGWYRGIDGAQAALMTTDGAGVAVQSTDYVAPGQVGWFIVRFKARAEVGTYTVHLLPRIDGRGLLPELGIFTVVTVAKNP